VPEPSIISRFRARHRARKKVSRREQPSNFNCKHPRILMFPTAQPWFPITTPIVDLQQLEILENASEKLLADVRDYEPRKTTVGLTTREFITRHVVQEVIESESEESVDGQMDWNVMVDSSREDEMESEQSNQSDLESEHDERIEDLQAHELAQIRRDFMQ
jgi:hypothetical protein